MNIVYYNRKRFKVSVSLANTTIFESYKIKSLKDMSGFLNHIRTKFYPYGSINIRSIKSMIREWRVHNLLYSLHIMRNRTKDVDLNVWQPWYVKTLYTILSPFYLHFSKK